MDFCGIMHSNMFRIAAFFTIRIIIGIMCKSIISGKHYPDFQNHGFAWVFG